MISKCLASGVLCMMAFSAGFAQECSFFVLNRVPIGQYNQPVIESTYKVNSTKGLRARKIARTTHDLDTSFRHNVRKGCRIGDDSIFVYPAGELKFCLPSRFEYIDSRYQPSHLSNWWLPALVKTGGPKLDSIRMIRTNKKFFYVKDLSDRKVFLLSCVFFYDPSREEGKGVVEDYTNIYASYFDNMLLSDSALEGAMIQKFQRDFTRFVRKYPQSAYAPSLLQFLDFTIVRCVRTKNMEFLFEVFRYLLNQRSIFGERFVRLLSESMHYTQKQWKLGDEEMDSLFSGEPNAYDYYFKTPVHNALARLQKK